jgi:hypothetical protein
MGGGGAPTVRFAPVVPWAKAGPAEMFTCIAPFSGADCCEYLHCALRIQRLAHDLENKCL